MENDRKRYRTKGDFRILCLKFFGIPAAIMQVVIWGDFSFGAPLEGWWLASWWLFLIATGLAGSQLFAVMAWQLMPEAREGRGNS